ncbi:MAG: 3-keto-5-aminohexanoate cleavage protein [Clostridia bacterium]|nr:3-keto-5-aminohexanoate cleavage protein [Clostridia bacterium]
MDKIILTAAICGAEVTKAHNPAVPYTVEEIAAEAKRSCDAGAAVIHLHVRCDDGRPTQDRERFRACIEAVRAACPEAIIQPSTGGAAGMTDEERLQPTELFPEMASLDCGTLNFGDDIFVNTKATIIAFAERMKQNHIKPELECFDKSMIDMALRLHKKGHIEAPLHFNFVVGLDGGISGELRDVAFLRDSIPQDATFTLTGIGRCAFPSVAMATLLGGHARVGLEDNIYLEKGLKAKSNGELVEKAASIARLLGREIASPAEARAILHLSK